LVIVIPWNEVTAERLYVTGTSRVLGEIVKSPGNEVRNVTTILIIGDIIILFLFSMLGRMAHQQSLELWAVSETTAPFVIGWLVAAVLVGALKPENLTTIRGTLHKAVLAWLIGVPLGLLIRALILQRWFHWSFILITMVGTLVMIVAWRMAYTLLLRKRES
jgi:hypothetical protein